MYRGNVRIGIISKAYSLLLEFCDLTLTTFLYLPLPGTPGTHQIINSAGTKQIITIVTTASALQGALQGQGLVSAAGGATRTITTMASTTPVVVSGAQVAQAGSLVSAEEAQLAEIAMDAEQSSGDAGAAAIDGTGLPMQVDGIADDYYYPLQVDGVDDNGTEGEAKEEESQGEGEQQMEQPVESEESAAAAEGDGQPEGDGTGDVAPEQAVLDAAAAAAMEESTEKPEADEPAEDSLPPASDTTAPESMDTTTPPDSADVKQETESGSDNLTGKIVILLLLHCYYYDNDYYYYTTATTTAAATAVANNYINFHLC